MTPKSPSQRVHVVVFPVGCEVKRGALPAGLSAGPILFLARALRHPQNCRDSVRHARGTAGSLFDTHALGGDAGEYVSPERSGVAAEPTQVRMCANRCNPITESNRAAA